MILPGTNYKRTNFNYFYCIEGTYKTYQKYRPYSNANGGSDSKRGVNIFYFPHVKQGLMYSFRWRTASWLAEYSRCTGSSGKQV